jgi:exodeoxyribonuclease-3
MKIATWNVNSVKARLEPALAWLKEASPDVVCLQEIKTVDENFPREAFEALGYNCAVHGQKSYNGVAILSKRVMEDVTPRRSQIRLQAGLARTAAAARKGPAEE